MSGCCIYVFSVIEIIIIKMKRFRRGRKTAVRRRKAFKSFRRRSHKRYNKPDAGYAEKV